MPKVWEIPKEQNKVKPPRLEIRQIQEFVTRDGLSIPVYGVFDADENVKLFQGCCYETREFCARLYSDSLDEMIRIMMRHARQKWAKTKGTFMAVPEEDKATRPGASLFPFVPVCFVPVDYDEAADEVYYEVFEVHDPDRKIFEQAISRKDVFEFGLKQYLNGSEAALDRAERTYLSTGSDAEKLAASRRTKSGVVWRYGQKGRRIYK